MNELALFAGAGGGLLGSRLLGWRTVCYVEKNPYCVEVIKARIRDGYLDDAPIWDDVRTFDGRPWAGLVDVVTAGFPCQPFSGAGKRLGERDERNLWPDTIRVIRQVRPRYALLENVPALTRREKVLVMVLDKVRQLGFLDENLQHKIRASYIRFYREAFGTSYFARVLGDLAESGYDCRWDCIPASAIGANHQRDRLWIVAHTQCPGRRGAVQQSDQDIRNAARNRPANHAIGSSGAMAHAASARDGQVAMEREQKQENIDVGGRGRDVSKDVSNAHGSELQESQDQREVQEALWGRPNIGRCNGITWWDVEPELGRVANGVAHRMDRLEAIGNGQVPAVVRAAWRLLSRECHGQPR